MHRRRTTDHGKHIEEIVTTLRTMVYLIDWLSFEPLEHTAPTAIDNNLPGSVVNQSLPHIVKS